MYEVDLASPSLGQDPDEDGGGPGLTGAHAHQHPHLHPDGSVSGGWHVHGHGAGHQHDALGPQGSGSGGDAGELASAGPAVELSAAPDLSGVSASPDEVSILYEVLAELDQMTDDELDELAAEGEGYPADLAPGTPFSDWMDALPTGEFASIREEAALHGGDEFGYLRAVRAIDMAAADANGREAARQQQDAEETARRSGPRHNRPSTEERLAGAVLRLSNSTFLYGQRPVDLAADPEIDGLLGITQATPLDAGNEMRYQLTGQGVPLARSRPQPGLPAVGALARRIGLHA